jgi:DNA polymerase III delta prime subunit
MDLWIEKYRPYTLNKIIGNKKILKYFRTIKKPKNLQNMLIYGEPGIGKSILVDSLLKNIYDNNVNILSLKYVNGEVYDNIKKFINKKTNNIKSIIIDNVTDMSKSEQHGLKCLIEQNNIKNRYIFICNNISNIENVLKNILMIINLTKIDDKIIFKLLNDILEIENISKRKYSEQSLLYLINICNYDIRRCINMIQSTLIVFDNITRNNINLMNSNINLKDIEHLMELCLNNKVLNAIKYINKIINKGGNINNIVEMIYNYLINNNKMTDENKFYYIQKIGYYKDKLINNNNIIQLHGLIAELCNN